MLQHFTWQQFLVATLILTLIWYAAIMVLFYRAAINDFLSGKRRLVTSPEPLPHIWDDDFDDRPLLEDEDSLMGKSAIPEGMMRLSMEQFGFAPDLKGQENEIDRDTKLGLMPDVLEELKSIFHILETEKGDKEDFISLFKMVNSKYSKIRNTPSQRALNEYIRENLPFDISDEELDNLWI